MSKNLAVVCGNQILGYTSYHSTGAAFTAYSVFKDALGGSIRAVGRRAARLSADRRMVEKAIRSGFYFAHKGEIAGTPVFVEPSTDD